MGKPVPVHQHACYDEQAVSKGLEEERLLACALSDPYEVQDVETSKNTEPVV